MATLNAGSVTTDPKPFISLDLKDYSFASRLSDHQKELFSIIRKGQTVLSPASETPPPLPPTNSDLLKNVTMLKTEAHKTKDPVKAKKSWVYRLLTAEELCSLIDPALSLTPDRINILKHLVNKTFRRVNRESELVAMKGYQKFLQNIETLTNKDTKPEEVERIRIELELDPRDDVRDDSVKCKLIRRVCIRMLNIDILTSGEFYKILRPVLDGILEFPIDTINDIIPQHDFNSIIDTTFLGISSFEEAQRFTTNFFKQAAMANLGTALSTINLSIDRMLSRSRL